MLFPFRDGGELHTACGCLTLPALRKARVMQQVFCLPHDGNGFCVLQGGVSLQINSIETDKTDQPTALSSAAAKSSIVICPPRTRGSTCVYSAQTSDVSVLSIQKTMLLEYSNSFAVVEPS